MQLWCSSVCRKLGKNLNRDDKEAIAENKGKYINFNTKINVELVGVKNKEGK